MLERLRICDFQAHEDLRLRLDPRVTVIVGPSDAGKSAVLRALWWHMTNQLRGDAFVREGQKSCSAMLWVDGRKITRSKGKSNSYRLDAEQYDAVSRDVPETIAKLLNVNEINFQGQHDAPFWLSLSAPEVARRLNEIVDLGAIDRIQNAVAALLRQERSTLSVVETRLTESESERERLSCVVEQDAELRELERQEAELVEQRNQLAKLDGLLVQINRLSAELRAIQVPDLSQLKTRHAALCAERDQLRKLKPLVYQIERCLSKVSLCRRELAETEQELSEFGDVCPTCGRAWNPVEV